MYRTLRTHPRTELGQPKLAEATVMRGALHWGLKRCLSVPHAVSLAILALVTCSPSNPTAPPPTSAPALKPLRWADVPPLPNQLGVGESFTATAGLSESVDADFTVPFVGCDLGSRAGSGAGGLRVHDHRREGRERAPDAHSKRPRLQHGGDHHLAPLGMDSPTASTGNAFD